MQSLKDAAVVLGLLLLLVSVKVTPVPDLGDVIPSAEAATADADGGMELAGFSADSLVPAVQHERAPGVEASNSQMEHVQVEVDTHRCDSSVVHVHTLELGGSGERIILRIDTSDSQAQAQAQVERVDVVEPAPRTAALEACKIG